MHWGSRILLAAMVAALVAWGPHTLERAASGNELERVEGERASLIESNRVLGSEIDGLEDEVRALSDDPQEVARIARGELNLVAPGEMVFEVERQRAAKAP